MERQTIRTERESDGPRDEKKEKFSFNIRYIRILLSMIGS
jgi:hypothetical protein